MLVDRRQVGVPAVLWLPAERNAAGGSGLLRRLYDWTMTLAAGPHATDGAGRGGVFGKLDLPDPARRHAGADGAGAAGAGLAAGPDRHRGFGAWAASPATRSATSCSRRWASGSSSSTAWATKFDEFQRTWNEWGLWIILIKGLTPIPYKLVTIASGLAKFNLGIFILASLVTRGARFFLVAALLRAFGAPIRTFIEQRLTLVTTSFAGAGRAGLRRPALPVRAEPMPTFADRSLMLLGSGGPGGPGRGPGSAVSGRA